MAVEQCLSIEPKWPPRSALVPWWTVAAGEIASTESLPMPIDFPLYQVSVVHHTLQQLLISTLDTANKVLTCCIVQRSCRDAHCAHGYQGSAVCAEVRLSTNSLLFPENCRLGRIKRSIVTRELLISPLFVTNGPQTNTIRKYFTCGIFRVGRVVVRLE